MKESPKCRKSVVYEKIRHKIDSGQYDVVWLQDENMSVFWSGEDKLKIVFSGNDWKCLNDYDYIYKHYVVEIEGVPLICILEVLYEQEDLYSPLALFAYNYMEDKGIIKNSEEDEEDYVEEEGLGG